MKLVKGIVRKDKIDEIAIALERAGAPAFTVMDAHGRGSTIRTGVYRGTPYAVLLPMSVIEIIVADECTDDVVQVLVDHAHTGHVGDGHVIVHAIEARYAVRTRWREVA
jgi:nitrogen regulatory protein PII